ncbi:MAG: biotin/lipoyl-binding protein [Chloroflexi bacterium]|nr:biotin/lipoyl-binding protein [Chloroflexota bacterium]
MSYEITGEITGREGTLKVAVDGQEIELTIMDDGEGNDQGWCRTSDGRSHRFLLSWVGDELHLWLDGYLFIYQRVDARRPDRREQSAAGDDILAPMPGTVAEILVQVGDRVERGQTVMIMESMKMELLIAAHRDGVVLRLAVEPGSQVDKGMRLLELQKDPQETG